VERAVRHHRKIEKHVTTFTTLGLAEPILKALQSEGYATPTPIQAQAIAPVLAGRDLLGIAQTGTGKTAAFALPILQLLAATRRQPERKGCRALVLSPTRELATQIAESFRTYGRLLNVRVAVVYGGVGHGPQIAAMAQGVDVLVATPGRLLDHIGERDISLRGTEILVLDEADQMLDLGFVKPIRRIVSHLPAQRQNLFFSATMPREIGALAGELLRNPVHVSVAPAATTVETVSQTVIHVEATRKRALLVALLSDPAISRALVFTRTKRGADRVARHLAEAGIGVAAIHGNKSQRQREQALEGFRRAKIRVLVATDIAARGIDIDEVSHVVNYELPDVAESYVHRIGRTARAGAQGIAISFCDGEERDQLREIERLTRQRIPAQDRRNDAALTADRAPVRSRRRAPAPRGKPAGRGHDGHHAKQNGHRHSDSQRPARRPHDNAHADAAPSQAREARPTAASPPRAAAGEDRSGMAGIAFMTAARPAAKGGANGFDERRNGGHRQGHRTEPPRPHRQGRPRRHRRSVEA
jgi:ATP-dependent RNA helicase RhlE